MTAAADGTGRSRSAAILGRFVRVETDEIRGLLLSALYFFLLLSGYYVLRPLREQMGLAGGVRNLPWLYLGTLAGTLAATPLFAALVARYPRRVFLPVTYRFFIANLLVFFGLFRFLSGESAVHAARAFYVWVSVFNMFAVSVFWGFMADLWRSGQGKRLFGLIGLGGTAGAVFGSSLTASLVEIVGPTHLLLISGLFLEAAVRVIRRIVRDAQSAGESTPAKEPGLGGSALEGIGAVARSPYLLGICLYLLLYTLTSTTAYFIQAHVVAGAVTEPAARTALFARIDLSVNLLTLGLQAFVTGRVLPRLGVSFTLCLLPAVTAIGFAALGFLPGLATLVVFQVIRRATNYGLSRPAREVLYTVVPATEKYKAKSFIDTFVYRSGDAAGAWAFRALTSAVSGLAAVAFLAVPLAAGWLAVGWILGRRQAALAEGEVS